MCGPESARLLSRPPAEWLQVMNRRDTLHAALQLQREASLLSSNLTVLHQYAIALHRMSTEALHSVFGWEFFPSGAVNEAAPVPVCFGRRIPGSGVPGLCLMSSAAVQLVVSRSSRTAHLHRFMPDLVVG